MDAWLHPDYPSEATYLRTVQAAAHAASASLAARDWRPASLADEHVADQLRAWAAQRAALLDAAQQHPYFGRIDTALASYYIGQAGLKDPDLGARLVLDWRSQAATAFYRPGPQVRRKRRYTMERAELREIIDDRLGGGSIEADPLLVQLLAVIGPNRLFLSYVAAVLPSLGEADVYQTTFLDWFERWCGPSRLRLPAWDATLEAALATRQGMPPQRIDAARFKGSRRMGQLLEGYVAALREDIGLRLLCEPIAFEVDCGRRATARLSLSEADRTRVVQQLDQQPLNRARAWAEPWLWSRIRQQLERAAERLSGTAGPPPRELVLAARTRFRATLAGVWPPLGLLRTHRQFLAKHPNCSAAEVQLLGDSPRLGWDDLGPLAYLKLLLDGPARVRDHQGRETERPQLWDHLAIDEAQDLSPLQLAVLRAHTRGATVLGDLAQCVNPLGGTRDWSDVQQLLPTDAARPPQLITLHQSYRATRQISALAHHILSHVPDAAASAPQAFPRDGEVPHLLAARTATEQVHLVASILSDLGGQDFQSLAVITRTARQAERMGAQVAPLVPDQVCVIQHAGDPRTHDTLVLPGYLAKGMDFDVVIVVDADAQHYRATAFDARLLYVAVTRAVHRLYVLWVGIHSPLLSGALR